LRSCVFVTCEGTGVPNVDAITFELEDADNEWRWFTRTGGVDDDEDDCDERLGAGDNNDTLPLSLASFDAFAIALTAAACAPADIAAADGGARGRSVAIFWAGCDNRCANGEDDGNEDTKLVASRKIVLRLLSSLGVVPFYNMMMMRMR
jgi:hypothetical protein